MKKIITLLSGLFMACGAYASPLQFTAATIQTNGAVAVAQTPDDYNLSAGNTGGFVSGYIDTVIVDFTAGTATTNTVVLSTLGDTGSGAARTLLTITNITGDGSYPVRDLVTTQAGADGTDTARIPLLHDQLRLTASATGTTDTNVVTFTMYIITTPNP